MFGLAEHQYRPPAQGKAALLVVVSITSVCLRIAQNAGSFNVFVRSLRVRLPLFGFPILAGRCTFVHESFVDVFLWLCRVAGCPSVAVCGGVLVCLKTIPPINTRSRRKKHASGEGVLADRTFGVVCPDAPCVWSCWRAGCGTHLHRGLSQKRELTVSNSWRNPENCGVRAGSPQREKEGRGGGVAERAQAKGSYIDWGGRKIRSPGAVVVAGSLPGQDNPLNCLTN